MRTREQEIEQAVAEVAYSAAVSHDAKWTFLVCAAFVLAADRVLSEADGLTLAQAATEERARLQALVNG